MTKNFFLFFVLITSSLVQTEIVDEIVVKGTWREADSSESTGSIVILDENTLEEQPLKHFEQLSFLIPNLNFAASDSRPRYFQIRGIGERSGYEGTPNSSVGFMIDDIDFSGQGGIGTTFDMEQIEVHRGPQGSRMGANALAGLIYLKSKDPSNYFEGHSQMTVGSDGIKSIAVAFGGPANKNETIKYRLTLVEDRMDGFRKNIYLDKSDTSRKHESTIRFKVNWDLTDKTEIDFLLMNVNLDDPSDVWNLDGSLNTLSDQPGMDSQDTHALGLKIFHSFNKFNFQSLTSTTHSDIVFSYDADWGNPISNFPYVYDFFSETLRTRRSFNQELRLLSFPANFVAGNRSEWIAGIYYLGLDEKNEKQDDGVYQDPFSGYDPYVVNTFSTSYYDSENVALFGHFEYLTSESSKLAFGLRWEDWKSNYSNSYGESFSPSDQMIGGKISFLNEINGTTNIFTSISRGYKPGGFNLGVSSQPGSSQDSLIYDPEYLMNYEIGLSLRLPKANLNLDIVTFYSDRKNQQVLISKQVDPNDPNTFIFLTQNAAEGENYGLEVNMHGLISDNLNFFSSLGILRTKINKYASRTELEGRDQAHAPEYSYALGLNWELNQNTYLTIETNGKAGFYYSDSHDNKSKSYVLTNLVLGYKKEKVTYELWAKNISDKYYSVRGFYFGNEPPNFPPTLYERQGDPRHLGLIVKYDF